MVASMFERLGRYVCIVLVTTLVMIALEACATQQPGSIGAILSRDNDTGALYVRDLVPGLAAEKAGLEPGDEIIMIEGRYVRDLEPIRVREQLRGDVGTFVRLTVVRGALVLRVRFARTELREPKEDEPQKKVETIAE